MMMTGQTLTNARVAMPGGTTLEQTAIDQFLHKDWLGSVRLSSNRSTRAYVFDRSFAPFGETYANFGGSDRYILTGDRQDITAGFYDTPARELIPNQGRWMVPDPAGLASADQSEAQRWNRYAYVINNPLGLIDPLGLRDCTGEADCKGVPPFTETVTATVDPVPTYTVTSNQDFDPTYGCHLGVNCVVPGNVPDGGGGPGKQPPDNCRPGTKGCSNVPTQYQQCISNFYNSNLGRTVQFGSPLALLPGWNPQWGNNLQEWGIAVFGKLGGLFGSGAMSGTTQVNTLSGTTTVGSTLELGTEAVLGAVEKAAVPLMVAATSMDVFAHQDCATGNPYSSSPGH